MTISEKLIIAIDGYSSCGKSTFAKAIADMLSYIYIDSGAMYRAVTLFAIENGIISNDFLDKEKLISSLNEINISFKKDMLTGKCLTYLNGNNVEEKIRGIEVSSWVSRISTIKEVRQKLVELQRKMGESGGVVLDGRDIGTVVFPDADLKIFMTASPQIRAQRRYDELEAKGLDVSFEEILKNIVERDEMDTTRVESPLIKADDAIVLDNSNMTVEQQLKWFVDLLKDKFNILLGY